MKRPIPMVLMLVAALLLSGCGGNPPAPQESPIASPDAGKTPAAVQEPFTREDINQFSQGLAVIEDALDLADAQQYEIEYWEADGSVHVYCLGSNGQPVDEEPQFAFFTADWQGEDGESITGTFDRSTFPAELLPLSVRIEYAVFSEVPLPPVRNVQIGSDASDVLGAFPGAGDEIAPRVLYDLTALNPQADPDWGELGDGLVIGGQIIRNEDGRRRSSMFTAM